MTSINQQRCLLGILGLFVFSLQGCDRSCPPKIEEVRGFQEVDDIAEWLSDDGQLLAECYEYCVGYRAVSACRFKSFSPDQEQVSSVGGSGGAGGSTSGSDAISGIIEVICTADTSDTCHQNGKR